jgi:hypothetical protein
MYFELHASTLVLVGLLCFAVGFGLGLGIFE